MKRKKTFKKFLEEKNFDFSDMNESILGGVWGGLKGFAYGGATDNIEEAERILGKDMERIFDKFANQLPSIQFSPEEVEFVKENLDFNVHNIIYKTMNIKIMKIGGWGGAQITGKEELLIDPNDSGRTP